MGLKQSVYIWLYPDNPMSIMADIFVGSILLCLLYLIFFHNLIGYMILDWKGMFDIERKPFNNKQIYTTFAGGDLEEKEVDVTHEIGLALSGIQDADVLGSMITDTGYNAYEVFYLMYFIWRDSQDIINGRAEKTIISNTEISFCMGEGEMIVYKDGSANINTAFGDIETSIKELREYVQNPYNFQYLAGRINLV
ncbi:TPA: hypothetical protein IVO84_000331 [Enterococcus faecium]|uniref:Uncharacterized protein n=2 Tax=Enterococcus faecium TaxID=1352 RepID=A0AAV3H0F2_ENTFC|nr:hypothetical protein [Enterococcus faecium]EJX56271.1 hypothetical protein HMPREF1378_00090 [Enterococcus faecium R496]EOI52584.1 hypothetical protein UKE_03081 [Enterococcus faecium EnGen0314]EOI60131.1 hypothetical protein UKI_03001 [Enterococcus faecium EnGen0318]EOI67378.1 hypothetical protein UKK_02979 [Enterococcus faecium EnGen0319]EOI68271.1 hypothetical protein UKM_03078 [Enterococcus faecium EnGen0321]